MKPDIFHQRFPFTEAIDAKAEYLAGLIVSRASEVRGHELRELDMDMDALRKAIWEEIKKDDWIEVGCAEEYVRAMALESKQRIRETVKTEIEEHDWAEFVSTDEVLFEMNRLRRALKSSEILPEDILGVMKGEFGVTYRDYSGPAPILEETGDADTPKYVPGAAVYGNDTFVNF